MSGNIWSINWLSGGCANWQVVSRNAERKESTQTCTRDAATETIPAQWPHKGAGMLRTESSPTDSATWERTLHQGPAQVAADKVPRKQDHTESAQGQRMCEGTSTPASQTRTQTRRKGCPSQLTDQFLGHYTATQRCSLMCIDMKCSINTSHMLKDYCFMKP